MTERDKDDVVREFAPKMQEIRNAQPTEAGIQALTTDVEFLLNVREGDKARANA